MRTIDDLIAALDAILERTEAEPSRLGYFAALYRKVTVRVKEGIAAGECDDGERMERLDVAFGRRYVEAYDRLQRGEAPSESWQKAFEAAADERLLILQHLLLGINAHINLDLPLAAAEIMPVGEIEPLEGDFMRITAILVAMVDAVQDDIGRVSPWMWWLDRLAGLEDERFANFSLAKAREAAWLGATRLSRMEPGDRLPAEQILDVYVAALTSMITEPRGLVQAAIRVIGMRESNDVGRNIAALR